MKKFSRIVSNFLILSLVLGSTIQAVGLAGFRGTLFGGKALVGIVSQIVEKTITVEQKGATQVEVTTTEVTKFRKGGRKVNLGDLKLGDKLVATGAVSPDGTFLAKSVVVKGKILREFKRKALYGLVEQISKDSFTLRHPNQKILNEVSVNNQTVFRDRGKKIDFGKVGTGQRLVAMVVEEDLGILGARLVVLLPHPAGSAESQASPSAKGE